MTLNQVVEEYLNSNGIKKEYFASYIGCGLSKCTMWFKGERNHQYSILNAHLYMYIFVEIHRNQLYFIFQQLTSRRTHLKNSDSNLSRRIEFKQAYMTVFGEFHRMEF